MKIIIKYLLIFFSKALAKKKFNKYFIKDIPKLVRRLVISDHALYIETYKKLSVQYV